MKLAYTASLYIVMGHRQDAHAIVHDSRFEAIRSQWRAVPCTEFSTCKAVSDGGVAKSCVQKCRIVEWLHPVPLELNKTRHFSRSTVPTSVKDSGYKSIVFSSTNNNTGYHTAGVFQNSL